MGDSIGRVALFGIPFQQEWLYESSGDDAPTYYLSSDAPLYYYSFTDAYIAMQYRSLSRDEQARFDPMITGFNPGDLYAAEHIPARAATFPGVFTGIGEFSVHKEFVSDKARPGPANLLGPASTASSPPPVRSGFSRSCTTTWMCRSRPALRNRRTSSR
jgi:hypothetical protein